MGTLFEEIRIFAVRIGTLRSLLLHVALVLVFGIWIPRMKDLDFLDTQVLGAYACLGLIFAAPAAAQAFQGDVFPTFRQVLARVFASVLYGELVVAALLAAGIGTIYVMRRGGFVPTPDWDTLARCALFGLSAAAMLASLAAWVTVEFSRRIAMVCLRVAFFGLLILFYFRGQRLPDIGLVGAAACLGPTVVFLALLRRACK